TAGRNSAAARARRAALTAAAVCQWRERTDFLVDPELRRDRNGNGRHGAAVGRGDFPAEQPALDKVRVPERLLERGDNGYATIGGGENRLPMGGGLGGDDVSHGLGRGFRVALIVDEFGREADRFGESVPEMLFERAAG